MMRRRRWGRSWTGTSILVRGRLGRRRFGGCCMMSGLRMRRLLRRRRWMLREMRRGMLGCCGRWRRGRLLVDRPGGRMGHRKAQIMLGLMLAGAASLRGQVKAPLAAVDVAPPPNERFPAEWYPAGEDSMEAPVAGAPFTGTVLMKIGAEPLMQSQSVT